MVRLKERTAQNPAKESHPAFEKTRAEGYFTATKVNFSRCENPGS
jgi:hypothetical protein